MERLIKEIKVCLILAIRDEFYTFDLIEIHVEPVAKLTLTLNFKIFFLFLHCILLVAKVKLFQGIIGRNPDNCLEKWQKSSNSDFMVLDQI